MSTLPADPAVHKGIAFLKDNYTHESPLACALTVDLLAHSQASLSVRQVIAAHLQKILTANWLREAPLAELLTAVNALYDHAAGHVQGDTIAIVAERLIAAEQAPGGPYHDGQGRLDYYTNVQVQRFASWAAGSLPRVEEFLTNADADSLYPSWMHDMKALVTLGGSSQAADGGWEACEIRSMPHPIRSRIVGTAHAIALLDSILRTPNGVDRHTVRILSRTNHELSLLFDGLQGKNARRTLDRIAQANHGHEITRIASYMAAAFHEPLSDDDITLLGQANVYCWFGYMLYDTIIDTTEYTEYIPLATTATRRSMRLYDAFAPDASELIEQAFETMDQANTWELYHARFTVSSASIVIGRLPQYGDRMQLANRSQGHIIGPLLVAARFRPHSLHAIRQALQHYLIARQLHDDAHDWQEDLAAGHISYVVAKLLRSAGMRPGTYDITVLMADLQALFWHKEALTLCDCIDTHLARARHYLAEAGVTSAPDFETLITRLAQASIETRNVHRKGIAFVQQFGKSKSPIS